MAYPTLLQLGWKPFFDDQLADHRRSGGWLSDGGGRAGVPVRVMSVHRGMVTVLGATLEASIASALPVAGGAQDRPTVGDWLLIDSDTRALLRLLERTSLFARPAPGDDRRIQLIAANVDTLFIVTSCNQEFNVARLERYLVLAREARVRPVIVLTKADVAADPAMFLDAVRSLQPDLDIALVNGRDPDSVARLAAYCGLGQTVALVGSSGVGKSTLVNTLRGSDEIETQPVREDDGKGLHTTTVRQMHRLGRGAQGGGWLVDTPGMRELQMSEVTAGVAEVFDDVVGIARACRFSNCTHADEPGCAMRAAIAAGTLSPERVDRWRKLSEEDLANTALAATRRARPPKSRRRS